MILNFTLSERDAIALSEDYFRNSATHQRARTRARWSIPVIFSICLILLFALAEPEMPLVITFGLMICGWPIFYPSRFDARVRRHTLAQLREASYAKNMGQYRLEITNECLISSGPMGKSEMAWPAIDRVTLTPDYLFICFSGMTGLAIAVPQIGAEKAQAAHDLLVSKQAAA